MIDVIDSGASGTASTGFAIGFGGVISSIGVSFPATAITLAGIPGTTAFNITSARPLTFSSLDWTYTLASTLTTANTIIIRAQVYQNNSYPLAPSNVFNPLATTIAPGTPVLSGTTPGGTIIYGSSTFAPITVSTSDPGFPNRLLLVFTASSTNTVLEEKLFGGYVSGGLGN
jgi:hypothetical protein